MENRTVLNNTTTSRVRTGTRKLGPSEQGCIERDRGVGGHYPAGVFVGRSLLNERERTRRRFGARVEIDSASKHPRNAVCAGVGNGVDAVFARAISTGLVLNQHSITNSKLNSVDDQRSSRPGHRLVNTVVGSA